MGIAKGPAILLMKEAKRRPFKGSLLTLGKQELLISPFQLEHYAKKIGFPFEKLPCKDPYAPMLDKDFFPLLGFSELNSLDYSAFEGASIKFDLNSGETPEAYREAFDVIYDGGTIEHIFNLPNALKSLIWMLKPGGRLIHLSPASNLLEHSFYMFSPTFFYDYYQCNHFDINYIQIVRCTPCFDSEYIIYDYTKGGCLAHTDVGMGRLDKGMYLVHTVVTKTTQSTSHINPNQSIYSNEIWRNSQSVSSSSFLEKMLKLKHRKWKQHFKKSFFYPFWVYCKLKLRKHGIPLKISDRF